MTAGARPRKQRSRRECTPHGVLCNAEQRNNQQQGCNPVRHRTSTSTPPSSNVPRAHGGGGEAVRLLEELLTAQGGVVVSKELIRLCGHWPRLPRTRRPLVRGDFTPRDYPGIGSITIET